MEKKRKKQLVAFELLIKSPYLTTTMFCFCFARIFLFSFSFTLMVEHHRCIFRGFSAPVSGVVLFCLLEEADVAGRGGVIIQAGGGAPIFICDLQPSASFRGRAEPLRLCCPGALWDLKRERETVCVFGDAPSLSFL